MSVRTGAGSAAPRASRINWKLVSLAIVAVCIVLLAVANAHLVYVAVASQPGCVPHAKDGGAPGTFKAAKPAC